MKKKGKRSFRGGFDLGWILIVGALLVVWLCIFNTFQARAELNQRVERWMNQK